MANETRPSCSETAVPGELMGFGSLRRGGKRGSIGPIFPCGSRGGVPSRTLAWTAVVVATAFRFRWPTLGLTDLDPAEMLGS